MKKGVYEVRGREIDCEFVLVELCEYWNLEGDTEAASAMFMYFHTKLARGSYRSGGGRFVAAYVTHALHVRY